MSACFMVAIRAAWRHVGWLPFQPDATHQDMLRRIPSQNLILFCLLLLIVIPRAVWTHSDPIDFPLDRNFTSLEATLRFRDHRPLDATAVQMKKFVPELQLQPWLAAQLSRFGMHPVRAARCISMVAAVLTGWGLFLLARS